ncbi:MAG: hypothetical protein ACLP5H_17330 [Desulfomonilaceae bacterium]
MCKKNTKKPRARTQTPLMEVLGAEKGTPPVMHAAAFAGADVVPQHVSESRNNIQQMTTGMARMHVE